MIELRPHGRPLAIGHRGAAALAPENTLAALEAAVAHGVDVVEFDVREAAGALVLGHSADETPAEPLSLEDALAWFRGREVGLHVDVKGEGFEQRIVEALERHGLASRAFVSCSRPPVLRRFAALAPSLPRALSYPEDRLGISGSPLAAPFLGAGMHGLRAVLPWRIERLLRRAGATVASLHEPVIRRATVERCHALGVPVVAWTVDDPARVRELAELGVDGIVSDDPRVLAATLPG